MVREKQLQVQRRMLISGGRSPLLRIEKIFQNIFINRRVNGDDDKIIDSDLGADDDKIIDSDLGADEFASISPIIIFYFSIILFLTFIVTNVGAAYISHRELASRTEAALSIAAQELDEFKYYYASPITEFFADNSINRGELKVPIDCADASNRFREVLSRESKSGNLRITDFDCNGYELIADVEEKVELVFQLRFLNITTYTNRVTAGTDSTYVEN